jgi:predicted HD phosphohydrolase
MLTSALLHDIGKPIVAYQKPEDIILNEYSFTDHEEKSYQIIKNIPFISSYTKELVRYHYLIRGMEKAKAKDDFTKYNSFLLKWNSLNQNFQQDLEEFLICDDLGKGTK